MQLNITTDYAVRIVLFLAMKRRIVSSGELSDKMKIPHSCVSKVTRRLAKAGIIETYVGKQGGFELAGMPEKITLLRIIEVMEPTVKINRCLEKDGACSRGGPGKCSMHDFYKEYQQEMEMKLSSVTIKDFIEKNKDV